MFLTAPRNSVSRKLNGLSNDESEGMRFAADTVCFPEIPTINGLRPL
jgi:hypothetical protein